MARRESRSRAAGRTSRRRGASSASQTRRATSLRGIPVIREVHREARMQRTMGKLPKGAIVPVGTHGSRSKLVVRYWDRKTGQFVSSRAPKKPKVPQRHPRTGIFITSTESELLKKRRPSSIARSRGDALRFVKVSPKARAFYDGLPRSWQTKMVNRIARALRDGEEPRIAARIGIKTVIRERRESRAREAGLL